MNEIPGKKIALDMPSNFIGHRAVLNVRFVQTARSHLPMKKSACIFFPGNEYVGGDRDKADWNQWMRVF